MTPAGRKLDRHLYRSIAEFKRYDMAGGKFFALIDESKASEERLDRLAEPLLEKMAAAEKLAGQAVETKHAKLDAVIDYIKRMDAVSTELGEGGNGGPTVKDSGELLKSSSAETEASTEQEKKD